MFAHRLRIDPLGGHCCFAPPFFFSVTFREESSNTIHLRGIRRAFGRSRNQVAVRVRWRKTTWAMQASVVLIGVVSMVERRENNELVVLALLVLVVVVWD